jgi:hypothetical protein
MIKDRGKESKEKSNERVKVEKRREEEKKEKV